MASHFDPGRHIFQSPEFRGVVHDAIYFFDSTPAYGLPTEGTFTGAGVYALYYVGTFELYRPYTLKNERKPVLPIYVGKAVPAGWRTGRVRQLETPELHRRLNEHGRSIEQVENLATGDFRYRFIILQDAEIDLVVPVEAELIRRYLPLWNTVVDGFGNHDPGSGRYDQAPSEWDILHPGRQWAERLRGIPPERDEIIRKISDYFLKLTSS
jgi:hypothetical protein